MDMKKIPKPRMEEYERRQRREREKYERQQIQPVDREHSLFPEPRRVDPSEGDDHITSKLGDYSKVKDFIGLNTVGIRPQQMPSNAALPVIMPGSASGGSGGVMPPSGSSRIPPLQSQQQSQQPSHHYQQQPQPSRQPYLKQADNKPPYNGRGGYPGQPVKNDLRSSSGMAPPKGPPLMTTASSQMPSTSLLQPPATSIMPNGRQSSVDKIGSSSSSTSSASFLGPPAPMSATHNGRFSQPSIPKNRQKLPPENHDVIKMISDITKTFRAPSKITEIAATPRITTTGANYNLNGPNKHKYSFSIEPITPLAPLEPFEPIQPLSDLPAVVTSAAPTSSVSAISSTIPSRPKEPIKQLKMEKSGPPLEKQSSTLEHDLELSESDDERKKHVSSPQNSSESSDSSDTGSEGSIRDEQQHHPQQHLPHQRVSVSTTSLGSSQTKKKVSQTATGGSGTTIGGMLICSGGIGSAGSNCSAPNSTSSSTKTSSKSDPKNWHLRQWFGTNTTQQTQNDSSPNGASGVPMTLPGGAHIIPEPTPTPLPKPSALGVAASSSLVTNVKNENIVDDDCDDCEDDDDYDAGGANSGDHHIVSPVSSIKDTFLHPVSYGVSRKSELSVLPLSLLDGIKKESDALFPHPMTKSMVQQQQVPLLNAAEFVAIPTSQIKNEGAPSVVGPSLIAGGVTTVTPYNKRSSPAASSPVVPPHMLHHSHHIHHPVHHHGDDINLGPELRQAATKYMPKEILSELSSDSNSSDVNEAVTIPVPGPGGTLQIPGVPAAITALPRSPPHMQLKPQMLPNSLTVTAINPASPTLSNTGVKFKTKSPSTVQLLGASGGVQRSKKKHKHKPLHHLHPPENIDSSDEEGEYSHTSSTAASTSVSPAVTGGSGVNKLQQHSVIADVAATPVSAATIVAAASAKKGRGRPRKNTPSQSGNISSASSTTTKGPTLTANKDVSSKKLTGRRKISHQSAGGNATSSATSTPHVTPTKPNNTNKQQATIAASHSSHKQRPQQQQQHKSNEYIASSEDSSTSSSSYSTSKSSTSSSDTEEVSGASDSSVDDHKKQNRNLSAATAAVTAAAVAPARRIVKQINKRKSLDDVGAAPPTNVASATTNTGKKGRTSSSHLTDDAFRDLSTTSSSEETSVEDYGVIVPTDSMSNVNAASNSLAHANSSTSESHRQQNQQSPLKVTATSKSQVSTSSSSAGSSSTSSSSGEDQSDSDCDVMRKEKKIRRFKPKSDKNKINTLSRIFNPKEGGAKKQGQVVIIDSSEELLAKEHHMQQHQQHLLQQKQPNAAFKSSSQENLPALATSATTGTSHSNSFHSSTAIAATTATTQSQSPRLTPSHMKSPRNPVVSATQQQYILSRTTPDRSSSSSERKLLQRIKTPTRTPTRTPPATRTPTPTQQHLNSSSSSSAAAAAAAAVVVASSPAVSPITSLICKIELSRLLHIAPEWHTNTYRLYTTATAPPPVAASPRTGHLTPSALSAAGRTPIYDHESILNADLQATQLRLKPSATGTGGSSGRNTPNMASIEQLQQQQRELSRSRESLIEMGTAKQRFDEVNSNSGRLSSRSVDSVGGGGGLTPKELPPPQMPPNGYTARGLSTLATGNGSPSATSKLMLGVKHEHIKFEPDIDTTMAPTAAYCPADTKFKSSSLVKQELILKQDFKPATAGELMPPSEKQLMAVDSPGALISGGDIVKPRRKRSSSSSSSPYKEKKRKKEKDKDKDREKEKDSSLTSKEKEKDKLNSTNNNINNSSNHRSTIADDAGMVADVGSNVNCVPQSKKELLLDPQLPPTNHDRLMDKPILAVAPTSQLQKSSQVTAAAAALHMPPPPPTTTAATTITTTAAATGIELSEESTAAAVSVSGSLLPTIAQSNITPLHSTHHSSLVTSSVPSTQQPQVIYRSYFERDEDVLSDDFSRNGKFLEEAVNRKHAADDEQNTFNQVTLYLEAVVYFLLSGAAMEQHRTSENAAWTIYKDTLALIKFISSKFRHLQVSSSNGQHETHNKVAILSLRCQSLISLKLYKMKRTFCRSVISACSEFFKSGKGDIVNGNTPSSISPSNSVCSQGSGSNTPPGKIVPQDVHTALLQQNQFFSYLTSSHDLWDQADRLVRQGNHTDFFIALDHENGPLTLHSSMYEVFRYVQAGLKKLKDAM